MTKVINPEGIVNLGELDQLAELEGADVQAQTTPVVASIMVSVLSVDAVSVAFGS